MRVLYHSTLVKQELASGSVIRVVPGKACLKLLKEGDEQDIDIIFNGNSIDPTTETIDLNSDAELVIRQHGEKQSYNVKPMVNALSSKYALAYEKFQYEYNDKPDNEIESIRAGFLKMYAVDQSSEVSDWTEIFEKIDGAFKAFKAICEKPKSHLKAVSEVRPIETVKRIGYESIPYLAAHSETWLTRTPSGLKPARLFSRVEDDNYQIYENRLTKTLIDLIVRFLRKTEKELKDQLEQLRGIMNSSVQTGSFGFDASFQKAVAELVISDNKGDEYRSKAFDLAEKLHIQALQILKKYRTLRQSRLYRYLKKSKAVINPLNETNILLMDKQYSVVFKLWKAIHNVIAPQQLIIEQVLDSKYTYSDYLLFCKTLFGYSSHVLNFDTKEDGLFYRANDNLELSVCESSNLIHVVLRDKTKRSLKIQSGLKVPIAPGSSFEDFIFDGETLFWDNTTDVAAIERFCSLFKTRESRGKEQADEKRRYSAIKQAIDQRQREYTPSLKSEVIIWPAIVELENDNRNVFKEYVKTYATKLAEEYNAAYVIVALPKCEENEQKIIEYAKDEKSRALILPLTMFDINSFRRLQNVLLRQIVSLGGRQCPACGGEMRVHDNQHVCDNCNQLMLIKTVCPNLKCRHEYYYLSYKASTDTILKMQSVEPDNFYQTDSLYQYKDIVPMSIEGGKIRTICPCCHNR